MKDETVQKPKPLKKRPDMTWHDHLLLLLHVGAEIEHGLMVQYLYAAYSLGGEQVPEKHRPMVQRWQKSILAVAKEEMGHLLTVQNILCVLGGPVNLDREDFPWDTAYYPFPFMLEPFTMDSLSAYVYAEMPPKDPFTGLKGKDLPARYREFEEEDKAAITERVRQRVTTGKPHEVGTIYNEIVAILEHPEWIRDSAFQENTFSMQASWDDWGRGYGPNPHMLDAEGNRIKETAVAHSHAKGPPSTRDAHVLIDQVATRTQAIRALKALGGQGEAPHLKRDDTGEPSHFERFLEIYQEFERVDGWNPSRDVPVNPTTLEDPDAGNRGEFIEAKHARYWANLFNVRYRMLLSYLSHTFRLARVTRADEPSVRAMIMHKVFGEMYNLKTIAGILVRMPRRDRAHRREGAPEGAAFAGPPFEIPYSLRLPPSEADTWRLHQQLLASSAHLCGEILPDAYQDGGQYLKTLFDLDRQTSIWIDKVLAGVGSTERHFV